MFTNPARCSSSALCNAATRTLPRGGNLARSIVASSRAGLSSFLQKRPDKFGAYNSNCHEAGTSLPARGGAGAAFSRYAARHAKLRPLPSLEINDVGHWCFSRLHNEKYLEAFPLWRKILPRLRKILPPWRAA